MIQLLLWVIALFLGWVAWEIRQKQTATADIRRRLYAGLRGPGAWTGLWVVEIVGQHADSIRESVHESCHGIGSPAELARALMAVGNARVVDHLLGPTGQSKEEALDWVEKIGPRLGTIRFETTGARDDRHIFALAYASECNPPSRRSLSLIAEYLEDSFAASLVACVQVVKRSGLVQLATRWTFVAFVSVGGLSLLWNTSWVQKSAQYESVWGPASVPVNKGEAAELPTAPLSAVTPEPPQLASSSTPSPLVPALGPPLPPANSVGNPTGKKAKDNSAGNKGTKPAGKQTVPDRPKDPPKNATAKTKPDAETGEPPKRTPQKPIESKPRQDSLPTPETGKK